MFLTSLSVDTSGIFTPELVIPPVLSPIFCLVQDSKDSFTWFPVLMQEVLKGTTPSSAMASSSSMII